jgi:hypothetical protein
MGSMRYAIWVGCGLWMAGLAVASCGGSSSETPWPVEPDTSALGPAGELGSGAAVDERAQPEGDAGAPARRKEKE